MADFFKTVDKVEFGKVPVCGWCGSVIKQNHWDGKLWNFGLSECLPLHEKCKETQLVNCVTCGEQFAKHLYVTHSNLQVFCPTAPQVPLPSIRLEKSSQKNECPKCLGLKAKECTHCCRIFVPLNPEDTMCRLCKDSVRQCSTCGKLTTNIHPYEDPPKCMECEPVIYKIKEWDWKPKKHKIWKVSKNPKELLFGMEVEVNLKHLASKNWENWVHHIMKRQKGRNTRYYCKWDGTIMPGFELVFMPMDWAYLLKVKWDWVFDLEKDRNLGFTGQGIHVHMNREAFNSPLHIFKFSNFIYNNFNLCSYIFERVPTQYCSTNLDLKLSRAVREEIGVAKLHGGNTELYNFKRRRLVNHINQHTVELRGFKTNLAPQNFWKNLEFVRSLFFFSRDSGVSDVEEEKYLDFVHKQDYCANLIEFLKQYNDDYRQLMAYKKTMYTPWNAIFTPTYMRPRKQEQNKKKSNVLSGEMLIQSANWAAVNSVGWVAAPEEQNLHDDSDYEIEEQDTYDEEDY